MTNLTDHWRLEFENKYLGAWNLWDKGRNAYRTATVTIREIRVEVIVMQGGRKERKPLVYFVGKQVPMVLTKTMGKVLEQMHGVQPSGWIGKSITIYVERGVRVQAGKGDVLRIKNERAGADLREEMQEVSETEQFGEDDDTPKPE